jgi:serine/threonine protein kinase
VDSSEKTQQVILSCVRCGQPDSPQHPCGCALQGPNEIAQTQNSKSQSPADRWIGAQIQQYQIDSLIASGGMGAVYSARHMLLGTKRAIKLMRDDMNTDPKAVQRFEQEARAINELSHAGIVAFHDYGFADGKAYVVMDLLEGWTISEMIEKKGPMEPATCSEIFIQVCDALSHAHERGILHRDLKPSNIMLLSEEGDQIKAKVLDFGIAKIESKDGQRLTTTGEVFGSPAYMAPEQGLGGSVDARSDIYSLGCVMFEALTAEPPFEGNNAIETIMFHVNKEAPRLLTKVKTDSDLQKAFDKIVARCLEKDPANRYQKMSDLRDDLIKAKEGDKLIALQMQTLQRKRLPILMRVYNLILLVAFILLIPIAFYFAYFDANNWRHELQDALSTPDEADQLLPGIVKDIPQGDSRNLYVSYVMWNHAQLVRSRASGRKSELERARKIYHEGRAYAVKAQQLNHVGLLSEVMISECDDGIAKTYENAPAKIPYLRELLDNCLKMKNHIIEVNGASPTTMRSKATTLELLAETYFADISQKKEELMTGCDHLKELVRIRSRYSPETWFLKRARFEYGVMLALLGEKSAAIKQMELASKIAPADSSKAPLSKRIDHTINILRTRDDFDKKELLAQVGAFMLEKGSEDAQGPEI